MDKELVKKIVIPRWGNFYFSRKYDPKKMEFLLIIARNIYLTITEIPILPTVASQIEEDVIRRSIYGTAALEGNPLSEERVSELLSEKDKRKSVHITEREILNLKVAYFFINDLNVKEGKLRITEMIIKRIHSIIMKGIEEKENRPGIYRIESVKVGDKDHGGTYTPPKSHKDITMLMREFIHFINSKELLEIDPVLRAAFAHYYLGRIHPFEDGNGRTARLVEAILIRSAGIKYFPTMLSNYYYQHMDDYYWAFSLAGKNKEKDITPFLEFVTKSVVESLQSIKENVIGNIRILTLKEFFSQLIKEKKVTHRQYDLLNMLLDSLKTFSLFDLQNSSPYNILYRDVTERTARRDINKLLKMNLLQKNEAGKYELNTRALG